MFVRDLRAAVIPSVTVPVSLIGTFGSTCLVDYSVDNLPFIPVTPWRLQ